MSPTPDARIFENLTETRIIIAGANGKVLDIAPKGMIQGLPEWALKSKALHRHMHAGRVRKLAGDDLPAPEEFAPAAVVDELAEVKAELSRAREAYDDLSGSWARLAKAMEEERAENHAALSTVLARLAALEKAPAPATAPEPAPAPAAEPAPAAPPAKPGK